MAEPGTEPCPPKQDARLLAVLRRREERRGQIVELESERRKCLVPPRADMDPNAEAQLQLLASRAQALRREITDDESAIEELLREIFGSSTSAI